MIHEIINQVSADMFRIEVVVILRRRSVNPQLPKNELDRWESFHWQVVNEASVW